ncbi:M15 family metallopeptidase [Lactococcus termiticola]|uniref:D-alanyl-D-alanine carboxypeptidase n=1 Tax=Lactococcus termiticola TaxID=2169526 RepID=A0A2R5HEZ8_9LACT|nr:M15 family metallopeptidase [Lactococcus termiticola]GBG96633.1 D-alanyl-D-alanine carboxypeptidase [Lactococcus termiticola]
MQRRTKKKKKLKLGRIIPVLLVLVLLIAGLSWFAISGHKKKSASSEGQKTTLTSQNSQGSSDKSSSDSGLPDAKKADWNLVLVNRDNLKPEMNPELTTIGSIQVDSRIAQATSEFLAAAQNIDPSEHLISGYRSVAYQTQLFNQYVENEMVGGAGSVNEGGPAISKEEATKNVQTYSQPPEASEHETGLAFDMSTVNSLNQSDPSVVEQVAKIAPEYGFVLRFPKDGMASTGVDYEDWHYRYVGVDNAKYMVAHNLTLEDYLKKLPE